MKKAFNRIIVELLTVVLTMTMFPLPAFAVEVDPQYPADTQQVVQEEQGEQADQTVQKKGALSARNTDTKAKRTMGTAFPYTGKAIKPAVKISGLNESCYTVSYSNNTKIGTAKVTIKAKGDGYKGTITKTFKIVKASNPLKVKGKTAKIKYRKLKKRNQTLTVTKVIKFTKKLKDKKTYTLSSAKKGNKSFKEYFKINKSTGKVTVKKGLKKGTYKVKVKVKASGNNLYKASKVKTVTITIKVK